MFSNTDVNILSKSDVRLISEANITAHGMQPLLIRASRRRPLINRRPSARSCVCWRQGFACESQRRLRLVSLDRADYQRVSSPHVGGFATPAGRAGPVPWCCLFRRTGFELRGNRICMKSPEGAYLLRLILVITNRRSGSEFEGTSGGHVSMRSVSNRLESNGGGTKCAAGRITHSNLSLRFTYTATRLLRKRGGD